MRTIRRKSASTCTVKVVDGGSLISSVKGLGGFEGQSNFWAKRHANLGLGDVPQGHDDASKADFMKTLGVTFHEHTFQIGGKRLGRHLALHLKLRVPLLVSFKMAAVLGYALLCFVASSHSLPVAE